jgi:thiamine biosynthesis lipoprotein
MKACHSFRFSSMGSACAVHLFADQETEAASVARAAIREVRRIEAKFSRYRMRGAVAKINRAAALGKSVSVDGETARLLHFAYRVHRMSEGKFDVTSGILRRAWDFSSGALPSRERIEALLPLVGMALLTWRSPRLDFARAGMELDFGGIGKEYAADRAALVCRRMGVVNSLVDLGGDLAVVGPLPDGTPWKILIRHPIRRDEPLVEIEVVRGGVATSGDYENCVESEGRRHSHILNPATGLSVQGLASVSVVAASCRLAGALSTTAMLMEQRGPEWLAKTGRSHAWVGVDGRVGGSLL